MVRGQLHLELRDDKRIQRSCLGLSLLGFRVFAGRLRLSRRRMRRYRRAREGCEHAYTAGVISSRGLQAGCAAALATTAHVDSRVWRALELMRRPALDV